jgi:uncharacterized membrane protein YtjA (UPF0391 family)
MLRWLMTFIVIEILVAILEFGNIIGGVVFVAFVKFSHVNPRNKHYMSSDKKK